MTMGEIRLQFVSGRGPLSKIIEWYGHGNYVHVDAILPRLHGKEFNEDTHLRLLGARFSGGVRIRPEGYKKFFRILQVTLPCSRVVEDKFYEFLYAQIGKPYDFKAIGGFFLNRDWRNDAKWFCSELIAAALCHAMYFRYPLFSDSNKIDPPGLLLLLSSVADIPRPWVRP